MTCWQCETGGGIVDRLNFDPVLHFSTTEFSILPLSLNCWKSEGRWWEQKGGGCTIKTAATFSQRIGSQWKWCCFRGKGYNTEHSVFPFVLFFFNENECCSCLVNLISPNGAKRAFLFSLFFLVKLVGDLDTVRWVNGNGKCECFSEEKYWLGIWLFCCNCFFFGWQYWKEIWETCVGYWMVFRIDLTKQIQVSLVKNSPLFRKFSRKFSCISEMERKWYSKTEVTNTWM